MITVPSMRPPIAQTAEQSEDLFKAIFDNSRDAIGISLAGINYSVNQAFLELFGYASESELRGLSILELISPGSRAQVQENARQRTLGTLDTNTYETRGLRKDGSEFDLEIKASVYALQENRYTLGMMRDITPFKRVEAELQESEKRYRDLFEHASLGIFKTGLDGKLVEVNPECAHIFGFASPEEAIALVKNSADLFADPQRRDEIIRLKEENPDLNKFENLYRRKDGSTFFGQLTLHASVDKDGHFNYVEGFVEDISERKQAEEEIRRINLELEERVAQRTLQLEAAIQELEAFSSAVSHDLRAPLRTLIGFSAILSEDYPGKIDQPGQYALSQISATAARMDQLIIDLLNLSRMARVELRRQVVDLSGLAGEIIEELLRRDPNRKVAFAVSPGLSAEGDLRLLRIVLGNLLDNAYKFTGRREQAHIQFGMSEGDFPRVFFVRDDGAGFDMAYAEKLFTPFQRLHGVHEFPGTGIGLATVQRIIRRHGGKIWAEAAPDSGATFYFTLEEAS